MDERDEAARDTGAPAKPVPIGLIRLRQHFVEPVVKNVKENAAAGLVAGLGAMLGADDEAPPSDAGAGPSRPLRRKRVAALGVLAVMAVVFIVGGLLR